jgi:hypothetical protein
MSQTTVSDSIQDITASLSSLMEHAVSTGTELLQILRASGSDLTSKVAPALKGLNLPRSRCGCDIPPPCWMPKELPEVCSHVCLGASATLRLRITNGGMAARTISVQADSGASVNPASLQLGPMQRGSITVTFTVPATACDNDRTEILIWVNGCNRFYLRWTVRVSRRGCDSCHEVDVEDCPDYIHHWYDHFYCPRPCPTQLRAPGP